MNPQDCKKFFVRKNPFDRKREFILTPEYIQYDQSDRREDTFSRIFKSEIVSIRNGLQWIQLDMFTIGRSYQLFIMDRAGDVFKLSWSSFFKIREKQHWEAYKEINEILWKFYIDEIVQAHTIKFNLEGQLQFEGIHVQLDGIFIHTSSAKPQFILWEDLSIETYPSNYVLYSLNTPSIRQSFYYLKVWNAEIIQVVVKSILRNKNLLPSNLFSFLALLHISLTV